jgi:hypothetical protein
MNPSRKSFSCPGVVATLLVALATAMHPAAARAQSTAPAEGADANEAFYERTAVCAAAMEVDQLALVRRAHEGAQGLRPQIFTLTRLGFTYVGMAYLKGLRDPRATQMLKAQRVEQKSWTPARHAQVVAECRKEAQAQYDDAPAMERWFADKKANSRVDKFLAGVPSGGTSGAAAAGSTAASAP